MSYKLQISAQTYGDVSLHRHWVRSVGPQKDVYCAGCSRLCSAYPLGCPTSVHSTSLFPCCQCAAGFWFVLRGHPTPNPCQVTRRQYRQCWAGSRKLRSQNCAMVKPPTYAPTNEWRFCLFPLKQTCIDVSTKRKVRGRFVECFFPAEARGRDVDLHILV